MDRIDDPPYRASEQPNNLFRSRRFRVRVSGDWCRDGMPRLWPSPEGVTEYEITQAGALVFLRKVESGKFLQGCLEKVEVIAPGFWIAVGDNPHYIPPQEED